MEVTRWRRRRYNPLYTAMIRNGQQRNGTLKTNLIIQRGEPKRKQKGALWAKALSQASVVLCLPARRARTPAPTHGAAIGWCLVDDMCVFDVRGSRQEASLIMSSLHARGRSTNSVLR
jgi:hypothetical protein